MIDYSNVLTVSTVEWFVLWDDSEFEIRTNMFDYWSRPEPDLVTRHTIQNTFCNSQFLNHCPNDVMQCYVCSVSHILCCVMPYIIIQTLYTDWSPKKGLYKIPDFKSEINVGQDQESSQIIISYSILGNIHIAFSFYFFCLMGTFSP